MQNTSGNHERIFADISQENAANINNSQENATNINNSLSEISIRDRLRSLSSSNNNIINIQALNSDDTKTGYKFTVTLIIFCPYVENNKTVFKDSIE